MLRMVADRGQVNRCCGTAQPASSRSCVGPGLGLQGGPNKAHGGVMGGRALASAPEPIDESGLAKPHAEHALGQDNAPGGIGLDQHRSTGRDRDVPTDRPKGWKRSVRPNDQVHNVLPLGDLAAFYAPFRLRVGGPASTSHLLGHGNTEPSRIEGHRRQDPSGGEVVDDHLSHGKTQPRAEDLEFPVGPRQCHHPNGREPGWRNVHERGIIRFDALDHARPPAERREEFALVQAIVTVAPPSRPGVADPFPGSFTAARRIRLGEEVARRQRSRRSEPPIVIAGFSERHDRLDRGQVVKHAVMEEPVLPVDAVQIIRDRLEQTAEHHPLGR